MTDLTPKSWNYGSKGRTPSVAEYILFPIGPDDMAWFASADICYS